MKKARALCAALALTLSLTACGGGLTTFDASAYLQGLLDATYKGEFSPEYLSMVELTEEQARESYQSGLEVEYEYFAANFRFDADYLTDDTRQAALDLLAELSSRARYDMGPATRTDNGFIVEVAVQPVDLIATVAGEYMEEYVADFERQYRNVTTESLNELSRREYEDFLTEYENDWATGILELFETHMNDLGYLEKTTILVQVTPGEDGLYTLSDADFANLDALILAYTAPAEAEEETEEKEADI